MKKVLIGLLFLMVFLGSSHQVLAMKTTNPKKQLKTLHQGLTKLNASLGQLKNNLEGLKNKLISKSSDAVSKGGAIDKPTSKSNDAVSKAGAIDKLTSKSSDAVSKSGDIDKPTSKSSDAVGKEVYITLVCGDIVQQQFQDNASAAIVNAANSAMRGGGGIDGAIHAAAGPGLLQEETNRNLSCPVGEARLTGGHKLAPRRIIHTVGPRVKDKTKGPTADDQNKLANAYTNCLVLADANGITAIAFNCISTAIFGYNINLATPVALTAVFKYLADHPESKIKEIRFVTFSTGDYGVYVRELAKQTITQEVYPVVKDGKADDFLMLDVGNKKDKNASLCYKYMRK